MYQKACVSFRVTIAAVSVVFVCSLFLVDFMRIKETRASVMGLPAPVRLLSASEHYSLPLLRGVKVDYNDPLNMDFIIDTADQGKVDKDEAQRLINYFYATIAVPDEALWVNLSPYEEDRVVEDTLAVTDLGRDLLAQDYVLKQFSSSLTYPDSESGAQYWDMIKRTNVAQNDSFNKIWIKPATARINEENGMAWISEATLTAQSERDYVARKIENRESPPAERAGKIDGTPEDGLDILLPAVIKEINEGKNFAKLRQIYHSMLLGMWFKKRFKESFYADLVEKENVKGIDSVDKNAKDRIYAVYKEAFEKGVYNLIKKEKDPVTEKKVARHYFSGGFEGESASALVEQTEAGMRAPEDQGNIGPDVHVKARLGLVDRARASINDRANKKLFLTAFKGFDGAEDFYKNPPDGYESRDIEYIVGQLQRLKNVQLLDLFSSVVKQYTTSLREAVELAEELNNFESATALKFLLNNIDNISGENRTDDLDSNSFWVMITDKNVQNLFLKTDQYSLREAISEFPSALKQEYREVLISVFTHIVEYNMHGFDPDAAALLIEKDFEQGFKYRKLSDNAKTLFTGLSKSDDARRFVISLQAIDVLENADELAEKYETVVGIMLGLIATVSLASEEISSVEEGYLFEYLLDGVARQRMPQSGMRSLGVDRGVVLHKNHRTAILKMARSYIDGTLDSALAERIKKIAAKSGDPFAVAAVLRSEIPFKDFATPSFASKYIDAAKMQGYGNDPVKLRFAKTRIKQAFPVEPGETKQEYKKRLAEFADVVVMHNQMREAIKERNGKVEFAKDVIMAAIEEIKALSSGGSSSALEVKIRENDTGRSLLNPEQLKTENSSVFANLHNFVSRHIVEVILTGVMVGVVGSYFYNKTQEDVITFSDETELRDDLLGFEAATMDLILDNFQNVMDGEKTDFQEKFIERVEAQLKARGAEIVKTVNNTITVRYRNGNEEEFVVIRKKVNGRDFYTLEPVSSAVGDGLVDGGISMQEAGEVLLVDKGSSALGKMFARVDYDFSQGINYTIISMNNITPEQIYAMAQ